MLAVLAWIYVKLAQREERQFEVNALERWRKSELFDERERVALDYAEAMTVTGAGVDDALIARLKRYFDEDAIVELTGLIAFQNLSSKFNSALAVPSQGFCRVPGASVESAAGRRPKADQADAEHPRSRTG